MKIIHTSDIRRFKRLWRTFGGFIFEVRGTGEVRYVHPLIAHSIRANDRRLDVTGNPMAS